MNEIWIREINKCTKLSLYPYKNGVGDLEGVNPRGFNISLLKI